MSHTTVSRKSHFQPSLAVKGSRADYRVAARNIGGSCEKRRIQLASSPLVRLQGVGSWYCFLGGTCSIIDAPINDLFLYRKQLRTGREEGKKEKNSYL